MLGGKDRENNTQRGGNRGEKKKRRTKYRISSRCKKIRKSEQAKRKMGGTNAVAASEKTGGQIVPFKREQDRKNRGCSQGHGTRSGPVSREDDPFIGSNNVSKNGEEREMLVGKPRQRRRGVRETLL